MAKEIKATEEQLTYAKVLDLGMKIGLISLIVLFIVYLTGILEPYIPVKDIPRYWSLSVHRTLRQQGFIRDGHGLSCLIKETSSTSLA